MPSEFFDHLMRWNVERNGTAAQQPLFFQEIAMMGAGFTAATAKIRPLLPHRDLIPLELTPGRALVLVACFEYRVCDLDPYNEVSIAFAATHQRGTLPGVGVLDALRRRVIPAYIWQLPVTTERARAVGVDHYGLPKFIADIRYEEANGVRTCTLATGDQIILQLKGQMLPARRSQQQRLVIYGVEGELVAQSNALINAPEFAQTLDRSAASLTLGDHPISQTLRGLGLSAGSAFYQYIPRAETILFPARNVADV
ncbi:MAG: acetoacetate decarboxylase family protein [Chloroflexi bacterium]|nr:acetoacetate decarboxylase family protein [Chloroflexota bacterium]